MRMFVARTVVAAVLVAVAATAAGCSRHMGDPIAQAVTSTTATQEYQAEEPHLQLAPGSKWPDRVSFPATSPDGGPMLYQRGYGTTRADHDWYCSWEDHLVGAAAQTQRERRADMAQLRHVRDTHMYVHDVIAVDRPYFNRVLDQALKGHQALMRRDVRLNCTASTATRAGLKNRHLTPTPIGVEPDEPG